MAITLDGSNGILSPDFEPSSSTTPTNGLFLPAANALGFATNSTERLRLDASGNLGIGTSSPSTKLTVYDASTPQVTFNNGTSSFIVGNNNGGNNHILYGTGAYPIIFYTNSAEAMRLDSSGNLLVGTTSSSVNARAAITQPNDIYYCLNLENTTTGSTPLGIRVKYTASGPNNAGAVFLTAADNSATRFELRSNGGLANFSANNVNLSDERVKTDITPAPSWLAKINAIEVVNFKYKDQTHDDFNLGAIAQQVQSVAPELVDTDGFGETPEDGIPLMAIFETDLKYAMLKAIQELTTRLEALEAK